MELSVILGRPKFIEKLLKMKPDLISYVGHSGHSTLALACLWGREESVDALFKGMGVSQTFFPRFFFSRCRFYKAWKWGGGDDAVRSGCTGWSPTPCRFGQRIRYFFRFFIQNLKHSQRLKKIRTRARKEPKRERNRFTATFTQPVTNMLTIFDKLITTNSFSIFTHNISYSERHAAEAKAAKKARRKKR